MIAGGNVRWRIGLTSKSFSSTKGQQGREDTDWKGISYLSREYEIRCERLNGTCRRKGLRQSWFFYLRRLTPIDVGRFIFSLPRGRGKQLPQNILATKIFEQP